MNLFIEGLWGVGKSKFIKSLNKTERFLNHKSIPEPIMPSAIVKKDEWYIQAHKENLDALLENHILERSILSSAAFLYANNDKKNYQICNKILKRNISKFTNGIVVYLTCNYDEYKSLKKSFSVKEQWFNKYEYFYTNILPKDFNVAVFEIPIYKDGKRRSVRELNSDINLMILNKRKAQVNVVPFFNEKTLILQRNERKGGFWQTITGGIEPTGSLSENTLREICEELNIKPTKSRLTWTGYSFAYIGSEGYMLREYVYGYRLSSKKIELSSEHVAYDFVPTISAKKRVKWDGNKKAIQIVAKTRNKRNGRS